MNPIDVYWSSSHRNFGDVLTPLLLERLFGIPFRHVSYRRAELVGLGSLLQKYTVPRLHWLRRLQESRRPPLRVWSTGFIEPVAPGRVLPRRLKVAALRGKRSRAELERITGARFEVPLGDGGLLVPHLLTQRPAIRHTFGLVPHYSDAADPAVRELANRLPDAAVIDVLAEPLETLERIASCRFILSSSLHGLIAADALGIPNRRLVFGGGLIGGDFKFDDYYSIYPQPPPPPLAPAEAAQLTPEAVESAYTITPADVQAVQERLLAALK